MDDDDDFQINEGHTSALGIEGVGTDTEPEGSVGAHGALNMMHHRSSNDPISEKNLKMQKSNGKSTSFTRPSSSITNYTS